MKTLKQISEQLKDGINQFIEAEESNENLFERTTADMKNRIQEAKTLVATAIVEEQRLKREYQQAVELLNSSREKSELDSKSQNEERNKEAQNRVNQHLQRANELESQIQTQAQVIAELTVALKEFYQQFHDISIEFENLSQRHQQAKTRAEFNKLLTEFELSDARIAIHEAKEELKKTETEVKKWEVLNQRKGNKSDKKKEEDINVDDALAALKRDILGSSQND